jgi:UDP-N-acetylmuramate--alanine ligase
VTAADELWSPPPGSVPTLPVPEMAGIGRAHLIGIGGAGMRNLARLLLARGVAVQGSDLKRSRALEDLEIAGVAVAQGHAASNVLERPRPDVVITSSAIAPDNPELVAAAEAGIPVWRRQQAVAAVAAGRRAIAIAGTHGKTTTTSMLAHVLVHAGLDPSYLIGGDLHETGGGARHGEGDVFVFEADESDGSFLLGSPWIGVITNIEVDHVDFYPGGGPEIERAFARFAAGCDLVVACADDPAVVRALAAAGVDAVTFGLSGAVRVAVRVDHLGPDGARGTLTVDGTDIPLALRVDGAHNLVDAAAAVAVAAEAGVDPAVAARALASFDGVHRRFELRGRARGADFFDDYGHIPTEMALTIHTARRRLPRRVVAIVQPHRYSRVQAMWRELGASVVDADLVVVTDIYGAAQPPIPGVTGQLVADGVATAASERGDGAGLEVVYLPHRADVVTYLADEVREGDLVVTMGCGDVWMLGDAVRERIEELDG